MHEFPNKPWSASGLDKLIDDRLTIHTCTDRINGSCRLKLLNQKNGRQIALA